MDKIKKGIVKNKNKYSIEPSDIGFDVEIAAEVSPTHGRGSAQARTDKPTNTVRQNLSIYPGE